MYKKMCRLSSMLVIACLSFSLPALAESVEKVNIVNVGFMLDKADNYVNKLTSIHIEKQNSEIISLIKIDKAIAQASAETDLKLFGCRQVNSNNLAYKESNVFTVNFAKEQNKNFERMASF